MKHSAHRELLCSQRLLLIDDIMRELTSAKAVSISLNNRIQVAYIDDDTFSVIRGVDHNTILMEDHTQNGVEDWEQDMEAVPIASLISLLEAIEEREFEVLKEAQTDYQFEDKPKTTYTKEEIRGIIKFFVDDTRGDKPWVDADDEWFDKLK